MGLFTAFSITAGSSLVGAFIARSLLASRHDAKFDEFDRQVTGETESSLKLYGVLKERMNSIFDQIDNNEEHSERRLENQRRTIGNLQETLNGYADSEAEVGDPLLRSFARRERELEELGELHA
jgi:hypothetical protein